jgi:hypothetical protein
LSPSAPPHLPADRHFGIFFGGVFLAIAGYGHFKGWQQLAVIGWAAGAGAFGVVALAAPNALRPLNRAWFWLGQLLGKVVSPIVLGIIFYGLITPVGVVGRRLGRDELRLNRRPVASYWIDRQPPGPEPDSFKHQF